MTPGDRPAALGFLLLSFALILFLWYLAYAIADIVRQRPIVTKDKFTGDLQIVRSPNPDHRPRRHGHPL